MEIKLSKTKVSRLKREFEMLYSSKEYSVSELGKRINYPGFAETDALTYIKNDAKIDAIHNTLLVLGINIWYDWNTKEAHLTDMQDNEIEGDD